MRITKDKGLISAVTANGSQAGLRGLQVVADGNVRYVTAMAQTSGVEK